MLKLLGKHAEDFSAVEEAAVARLAADGRRLVLLQGGRVETKSEAGFAASAAFLRSLAAAARALRVPMAPRSYRSAFTLNYQALFPDASQNYRVDVLEASVEQYAAIWVNGDKFEFSAEAVRRAKALQRVWAELTAVLRRWGRAAGGRGPRPAPSELRSALFTVDFAWASFEHRYIGELIGIEEKARRLLAQAVAHEERLRRLEAGAAQGEALRPLPEYCEEQKRLVACISQLNAVANAHRKGRDDLGVGVLLGAAAVLSHCGAAVGPRRPPLLQPTPPTQQLKGPAGVQGCDPGVAVQILACGVVESYGALRAYLQEVGRCLERVDPHLCNNAGLVERLVDWEESWELGAKYLQDAKLLGSLCDLAAQLGRAQQLVPALAVMCQDRDAELFLILPRLVWLGLLARPAEHAGLLQGMLPTARAGEAAFDGFARCAAEARELLAAAVQASVGFVMPEEAAAELAWEVFVKRATLGAEEGLEGALPLLAPDLRRQVCAVLEAFMRELETWSIALQRHCPEDWNQLAAVLVQSLAAGAHGGQVLVPLRI